MGDDALFRRLYPEWTGNTEPLITWAIFVIILILIPFLIYTFQEKILHLFLQSGRQFGLHRSLTKTRQLKISDFLVMDEK